MVLLIIDMGCCSLAYLNIFGLIFRVFVSKSRRILRHKQDFAFYVHLQMFHPKKRIFLCIGSFFARRWHSHAPLPHGAPLAER